MAQTIRIGLTVAAIVVFILYALLAGLTLALCGVEMSWLKMRCAVGTARERTRAKAIVRLKRRQTWMLCSMIICSVAAGQFLLLAIQYVWYGLYNSPWWLPLLSTTLFIALCGEIIPQYFIPHHPIEWGYACYPLIWLCMVVTAIITYPLSHILDRCIGRPRNTKNGELSNDELAALIEYYGSTLCKDTVRVMLGALNMDGRRVGCNICIVGDPEKAVDGVASLVTGWSTVKTIAIDQVVDQDFLKKLKSRPFSRIPVVGEGKVFGYLHVKNLVGIKLGSTIRNLPLCSIPIIQADMAVYEVLDLFQRQHSRIAIVIPNRFQSLHLLRLPSFESDVDSEVGGGVKCEPIGIVTFEDILRQILRREIVDLPPPAQPARGGPPQLTIVSRPATQSNRSASGTLRQRHVSRGNPKPIADLDGADERSSETTQNSRSSYTANPDGGFHGTTSSRSASEIPATVPPPPPWSRRYVSASPVLLPPVARISSLDELIMPKAPSKMSPTPESEISQSEREFVLHIRENTADTLSLPSATAAAAAAAAYDGFPLDLLDSVNPPHGSTRYMSSTLPRMIDFVGPEESFNDDRALLPSQNKARRSSSWF